jgi:hypothetical protein
MPYYPPSCLPRPLRPNMWYRENSSRRYLFLVSTTPFLPTRRSRHPPCFSISTWFIHISLAILTATKWNLIKMGAPVVRLVTRDGALTTVSICCGLPWILRIILVIWVKIFSLISGHTVLRFFQPSRKSTYRFQVRPAIALTPAKNPLWTDQQKYAAGQFHIFLSLWRSYLVIQFLCWLFLSKCCRIIMNMQSFEISAVENSSINTLSAINFEMDSSLRSPPGSIETIP